MKILSIYEKLNTPIVLGLGFFDCVHVGHRKLIYDVIALALKRGAAPAIFTFTGNPEKFKFVSVYDFDTRAEIFNNLGIEYCVAGSFDGDFTNLSGDDFLNILCDNFNIKGIVCGADYRYGKDAAHSLAELKKFATQKNIELKITPFVMSDNGEKVSTGIIYKLLKEGRLEEANIMLGTPYYVKGTVTSDFKRGRNYGFPTANLHLKNVLLPDGVYATLSKTESGTHMSVTNVGVKPTFDDSNKTIETHLINFDGDLYGKELTVCFYKKLRDIKKFESGEELYKQIKEDIKAASSYLNNYINNENQ